MLTGRTVEIEVGGLEEAEQRDSVELSRLCAFFVYSAALPAPSSVSHEPHYPPLLYKLLSHAGQPLSCLSMITTASANVYSRIPFYLCRHGCCLFSFCAYAKDVFSVKSLGLTCFSL